MILAPQMGEFKPGSSVIYPTIFDVLSDLRKYKINPNRFDKLWHKHRWELGKRVSYFDGTEIPPKTAAKFDCLGENGELYTILETQSGNMSSNIMAMSDVKEQNVQFNDTKVNHVVDVSGEMDATRMAQDSNDASLENFFRRPIKIADFDWSTSIAMNGNINPWALYFNNPRVTNRITNFHLLRCKLHLKFVVNGNAFLYGRAAAVYQPLASVDALTDTSPVAREAFTGISQMPKVFINPTESVAGEMKLPFFWPKNYMAIPTSDWDAAGQLIMRTINPLKHANGATESVTVSVFAWAEDVELSVLTSVDTDTILPQSGEIEEANKEGMISGPATRIASAANVVSQIPLIQPYAIATSKVASMTAQMAKLLGYARPNTTADPAPLRPTLVSNLATTTTPDGAVKITVDDKQELSVDPTITGVNCADPLDILSIAQRESYLTTFGWETANGPETHLWNIRVDPCTWSETGTPTRHYFPATACAALPFKYWTGTLNYRFQIVASGFHRGRLKFVYDPNFVATNEYNTNYLEIVDINEKTDFTISISNGQDRTFLRHIEAGFDSVTQSYSELPYGSKGFGNGTLSVYVVNELTTPNSVVNNDIEINVYISAGDDFQVAVPYDHFSRFVLKPQSGVLDPQSGELYDESAKDETDSPFQEESSQIGPTPDPLSNIAHVYMGETIKSFRPLLKRYALHEAIGPTSSSNRVMFGSRCIYPYFRGNVLGAVHEAVGPAPYNFVNTLLFHWIASAHSGHRGSMRYKIIPKGNRSSSVPQIGMVERVDFLSTQPNYTIGADNASSYTTVNASAHAAVLGTKFSGNYTKQSLVGINGMHRITSDVNPALEFEMPFYSDYRFVPGKHENLTGATSFLGIDMAGWTYRVYIDGSSDSLFDIYAACGEDWSPFFFTGLPPMYFENIPPEPAP